MSEIPWTTSPDEFDDLWDEDENDLQVVPDMLCTMFAQQRDHMQSYMAINEDAWPAPETWGDLEYPRLQASLRENAGYVVEELYEAINLLKNKPWKQSQVPVDWKEFREEIADVWHFLIQFHILAGVDPLDIFEEYFRKSLINENRREQGY